MQYIKHLLLLALVATTFTACQDDDYAPIGEPSDKVVAISDTWRLTTVEQTDNLTLAGLKSLDITTYFLGSEDFVIAFSMDGTYTVEDGGSDRNFFGTGGTWAYDDPEFPTNLTLTPIGGMAMVIDLEQAVLEVGNELKISQRRNCTDPSNTAEAPISYVYTFERS